MKILSKDAQNKIDQQLQSLQDEVLRLQALLDDKNKALAIQARELALTQASANKAEQAKLAVEGKANLEVAYTELSEMKKVLENKNYHLEVVVKELEEILASELSVDASQQS